MKKIILILLVVPFVMMSCERNKPVEPETGQTLLFYMPWSTDLLGYFEQNIADFETAVKSNILKNNRLIIFISTSPTKGEMFELKYRKGNCERVALKNYTESTLTTAGWITSMLNDVKSFAPANRYAMIIGSHGMGWIPVASPKARSGFREKEYWANEAAVKTRYFGGQTSQFQTDVTTLAQGIASAGMKMDYIMFDDCYMSTIEVAYDLKNVTDHLIASPNEVMIYGFPYHTTGKYLIGDVDYERICQGFYDFYSNYSTPCGTITVTKCAELDDLAVIMKQINQQFSFDPALLDNLQRMDGYTPARFLDYGDYVAKLCPDAALLATFRAQLERVVPSNYRKHTPTFYSMSWNSGHGGEITIDTFSGVTVSDPSISPTTILKDETSWYKATH